MKILSIPSSFTFLMFSWGTGGSFFLGGGVGEQTNMGEWGGKGIVNESKFLMTKLYDIMSITNASKLPSKKV